MKNKTKVFGKNSVFAGMAKHSRKDTKKMNKDLVKNLNKDVEFLQKEDINLVKPKFRQMVLDAWKRNEDVPYGVIYLSDVPLTKKDITHAEEIIKKYKIKD